MRQLFYIIAQKYETTFATESNINFVEPDL